MYVNLYIPSEHEELKRVPSGGLVLIKGSPDSYYSLVGRYILFNHCKNGGKVLYVTFDENAEDIREEMAAMGMNVSFYEVSGQWVFTDLYGKNSSAFNENDFIKYVKNGFWTALDSFSTFLSEYVSAESLMVPIKRLSYVFRLSTGLHFAYLIPDLHDVKLNVFLQQVADVIIDISYSEVGGTITRFLKITKIRRKPYQGIIIPFTITGYGLSFETVTRLA